MELQAAIPVFKISSERLAREHYVGYLGFTIDWIYQQDEYPVYLQIRKDKLIIHLTEHEGDAEPGSVVMVQASGVEDFYKTLRHHLSDNKFFYIHRTTSSTTLEIDDPFGNRIRFTEQNPM